VKYETLEKLREYPFYKRFIKHKRTKLKGLKIFLKELTSFKDDLGITDKDIRRLHRLITVLEKPQAIEFAFALLSSPLPQKPFIVTIHRLGNGRTDVKRVNALAEKVEMYNNGLSSTRKIHLALDLDFFWVHHNNKMSVFFGHPTKARKWVTKIRKGNDISEMKKDHLVSLPEGRITLARSDVYFHVELKNGVGSFDAAFDELWHAFVSHKRENKLIVSSFQPKWIQKIHTLHPQLKTYFLTAKVIGSRALKTSFENKKTTFLPSIVSLRNIHATGVGSWKFKTQKTGDKIIKNMHKYNLEYYCGGVENFEEFFLAYINDVDGCFINDNTFGEKFVEFLNHIYELESFSKYIESARALKMHG